MLRAEAAWLSRNISSLESCRLSPLLNVGSADAVFREVRQPWIDELLFAPLRARGVVVEHQDRYPADGIDILGDLTDEAFLERLASREFGSIMCCNVLEHVPDPLWLCSRLEDVVAPGGYVILSIPRKFPYHPDPIDTMFRPSVEELWSIFPRSRCVAGAIVDAGTGWDYAGRSPSTIVRGVLQRLVQGRRRDRVKGAGSFAPWLFRSFQVTCAVFQRCDDPTLTATAA